MDNGEIIIKIEGSAAESLTRVVCYWWKYKPTLQDGTDNPETPSQFTIRKIKSLLVKIIENAPV